MGGKTTFHPDENLIFQVGFLFERVWSMLPGDLHGVKKTQALYDKRRC